MAHALSTRARLVVLLLAALGWFGTLDYRKLIKPDEGRYAEISREMLAGGDWLTPRLNGIKYFEKPPLQYWTTAAAFKAFGLHEWTARLWTALAGFFTILLAWWTGRRLFGAAAGDYAAMVLASNAYFVLLGHVNSLDMGLTLFTTLAVTGFCMAQREGAAGPERARWMLVAWAAMALAVLSKGLIGIVLPGATLVVYCLAARDWSVWRRLHLLPGGLLFLALASPWFVAVSLANPEFPWAFFMEQHVLRYATGAGRREGPVYYFALVLLFGMLPWTLAMVDAVWSEAKAGLRRTPAERPALVLLAWIAVVFVFFSFSRSKLLSYVLPVVPALAMLIGRRLAEVSPARLAGMVLPVGIAALAASFPAALAPDLASDALLRPLLAQYVYWLLAAIACIVLGVLFCWRLAAGGRKTAGIVGLSAAGLAASLLIVNGHDSFAPSLSSHALAAKIRPAVPSDAPFYSVGIYEQTLPFYLERTLTPVAVRDELDYGLRQEPWLGVQTLEEFAQRWRADSRAYALTTPEYYQKLRDAGLPMEVLADDGRRIVVAKPVAKR